MSCDGWGTVDVYQASQDSMRLPGNWSRERELARARDKVKRERRREDDKQLGTPPPGWREALPEVARRRRWLEERRAEMAELRKETARKDREAGAKRRRELETELVRRRENHATPEGFGRLLTTYAEVQEELTRRRLLRDTGVPFVQWGRCITLAEAVIYCQAYRDQQQEGEP